MKKVQTIFITSVGLVGYSSLSVGVYLSQGLPAALILSGTLALVFALRAAAVSKGH